MSRPARMFLTKLLTNTKLLDASTISLDILALEVSKKVSSLTYHLQKTSSGVMVLLVDLEVLGKVVDPLGEDSDLYLRGSGVGLMSSVSFDNSSFLVFS